MARHGSSLRRVLARVCRPRMMALLLLATTAAEIGTSAAATTWQSEVKLPSARYAAVAVAAPDGRIFVLGGLSSRYRYLARMDVYTPSTKSWSRAAPMPVPRGFFAAALG